MEAAAWTHIGRGPLQRMGVAALGAFAALGFAPLHIWPATLLALAGLYLRVSEVSQWERPGRSAFATALLFGLGWFSASCFWIATAFFERGPEFVPLIPPLVGGLAVLLSLFWGLAMTGSARVMRGRPGWVGPLVFTGCLMLAEFARGHLFSGFPWNLPGYAFAPGGAASQGAWLVGIYGLSTGLVLSAALLGEALSRRALLPGALCAGMLAALFGYGTLRLSGAPAPGRGETQPGVTLRLVSVPFRQSEQFDRDSAREITRAYFAASVQPGVQDVTHLIWPESAVGGLASENRPLLEAMGRELSRGDPAPPVWILQSLREQITPDPRTGAPKARYYNSSVAVQFDAAGVPAIATSDDKRKLVPFGEFIPGGEIVERLGARMVSTALSSVTGADTKRVARYPGLPPLSAQICYEVIFPGLTPRALGDPGNDPQLILNQSNDAWFGDSVGPDQHAAIARYRAVEEGLPLVRVAANGVSGTFDAFGRVATALPDAGLAAGERGRGAPLHFVDAPLPRPLKRKVSQGLVNFSVGLLNLCLLLLSVAVRRGT